MQPRFALMSIVACGIAVGALASQTIPVAPRSVQEPAWRSLVQAQYRQAYTPAGRGTGPEDSTAAALLAVSYNRDDAQKDYVLPPEYAAAERYARSEAKAAAQAEQRFRLAYAEASRPVGEVRVTSGSLPITEDSAPPGNDQAEMAEAASEPEAKVITVAAMTAD
ncbi:hypothetical protein [Novosphingobium sp.]|uniref:hypothetical protein n=1 Tax=Novosphingobium sp. TaxID=1874826 RepID=UPI0025CD5400|nr:hypothetical protein [Novosphingobium sp.]